MAHGPKQIRKRPKGIPKKNIRKTRNLKLKKNQKTKIKAKA